MQAERLAMPARTLTLAALLERLEALAALSGTSTAIGVRDPQVAAYARVLEYGSLAGHRPWPSPGPRTTLAVDPQTGARVVVSAQAPQGFLRVQALAFPAEVARALQAPADWLDAQAAQSHVAEAVRHSAAAALEILRTSVPRDSTRLAESLEVLSE